MRPTSKRYNGRCRVRGEGCSVGESNRCGGGCCSWYHNHKPTYKARKRDNVCVVVVVVVTTDTQQVDTPRMMGTPQPDEVATNEPPVLDSESGRSL